MLVAAALSLVSLGAAHAVTFTVTEGNGHNRPQVLGSVDVGDASSGGAGINLNTLSGNTFGAADTIGIYGRIVGATDRFTYTFTATQGFNVSFDFDGYDLEGGGSVVAGRSGLINQNIVDGGGCLLQSVQIGLLRGRWVLSLRRAISSPTSRLRRHPARQFSGASSRASIA